MIKERAKRYSRLETPPNFEITPRLLRVHKDICNLPLIRQDQLAERHPNISSPALKAIIFNLFHGGIDAKPKQQADVHNSVPGQRPMYLSPDRLGTHLYSLFFSDPLPTPKYTQDNDRGKWSYIKHQHTTSSTVMQFEDGAGTVPGLTHLTQSDLWQRYAPNKRLNKTRYDIRDFPRLMSQDYLADPAAHGSIKTVPVPLKLKTRIDWNIKLPGNSHLTEITLPVSTEPDNYFGRQHLGATRFSFFESDEGTETILPGKDACRSMQLFFDTSLYQKYLIYISAFRHRAHVKQFGIPTFDVVTITTTPRRVDEIIKKLAPPLMNQFNIHPNFFLFLDRQTLEQHDNNPYHLDLRYKNLAGDDVNLLQM